MWLGFYQLSKGRLIVFLSCSQQTFKRYPALRERFNATVVNFFKKSMTPTTKLVTDMVSMQACYINTTHPDFIGGHQATALVTAQLNANKPQPGPVDAKRAAINNHKDLDVDIKKDEGFFSSFFAKGGPAKKKGAAAMDAPPPTIRPQNALSERETMETEVISALFGLFPYILVRLKLTDA